jgi:hypothetical protein
VADSCKQSNEPMGSIKGRVFLDELSDYQLHKRILLHGISCVKYNHIYFICLLMVYLTTLSVTQTIYKMCFTNKF